MKTKEAAEGVYGNDYSAFRDVFFGSKSTESAGTLSRVEIPDAEIHRRGAEAFMHHQKYTQAFGSITGHAPIITLPDKGTAPRAGIWQSAWHGIKFGGIVFAGILILAAIAKYGLGLPIPGLP